MDHIDIPLLLSVQAARGDEGTACGYCRLPRSIWCTTSRAALEGMGEIVR